MKTKKEHYKKVITWKQKPKYLEMFYCVLFTLVWISMCCLTLYYYNVPDEGWFTLFFLILMVFFGIKKLGGTLPKGRKVRYKKMGRKKK